MKVQLKDGLLLTYIIQQVVKQCLNCELLYQNLVSDRARYPFVTYSFISTEQDTTGDWLGEGRQYETHLQIDCHADNAIQAMDMANDLYNALQSNAYRSYFEQADIEPQEFTNTSDRTVRAGINYDYRFGFDCSFLLSNGGHIYQPEDLHFDPQPETEIDEVDINSADGGVTISAHKKKRSNSKWQKPLQMCVHLHE